MKGAFQSASVAAWAVLGAALAAGCASPRSPAPAVAVAEGGAALPFIENDFAQAWARAREARLPLFVEVWAPW